MTAMAALRRVWSRADPAPQALADEMIVAVASADLGRDYALLTLVDSGADAAVRGEADMLTMQFGDGYTSVLVHITTTEDDQRRLDGWVVGQVAEVHLVQHGHERRADTDGGRFSFAGVSPGIARVRVVLSAAPAPGAATELLTPRFEL